MGTLHAEDILSEGSQAEEDLEGLENAQSLLGRSVLNFRSLPRLHLASLGSSLLAIQMLVQCRRLEWDENEQWPLYPDLSSLFSVTEAVSWKPSSSPLLRVGFLLKMRMAPPLLTGKVLRQTVENDPMVPDLFKSEKTKTSHPTRLRVTDVAKEFFATLVVLRQRMFRFPCLTRQREKAPIPLMDLRNAGFCLGRRHPECSEGTDYTQNTVTSAKEGHRQFLLEPPGGANF